MPLRLFLGVTFLYAGLQKLTDPQFFSPTAPGFIGRQMSGFVHSGSPLSPLLIHLAIPHAAPFGALIAVCELWVALSALLGLLTRLGALGGLAISLTLFLTATWSVRPYFLGADLPYAMGWLTLLLAGPGRYSLDGYYIGVRAREQTAANKPAAAGGQRIPAGIPAPVASAATDAPVSVPRTGPRRTGPPLCSPRISGCSDGTSARPRPPSRSVSRRRPSGQAGGSGAAAGSPGPVEQAIGAAPLSVRQREAASRLVQAHKQANTSVRALQLTVAAFRALNRYIIQRLADAETQGDPANERDLLLANAILVYEVSDFVIRYMEAFEVWGVPEIERIQREVNRKIADYERHDRQVRKDAQDPTIRPSESALCQPMISRATGRAVRPQSVRSSPADAWYFSSTRRRDTASSSVPGSTMRAVA